MSLYIACTYSCALQFLLSCRWIERIDSFDTMYDLLHASVECLDTIRNDNTFNTESVTKANGLFHSLQQSEFIISLVVCKGLLAYTRGLTTKLQGRRVEMYEAYCDVKIVKETLEKIREEIEEKHRAWHATAIKMAEKIGSEIKLPRVCARQRNRNNTSAATPEEYFRIALSIPFLDHIIAELTNRFEEGQQHVPNGSMAIPNLMLTNAGWSEEFQNFTDFYNDDLPSEHTLTAEVRLWKEWWCKKETIPDTAQETLKAMDRSLFPNIFSMMKILCTLPVTSCECERSVSALRRLKNYMRTTMKQERLNGLALLHVHYELDVNVEKVLDIFARKHPRRLTFLDSE